MLHLQLLGTITQCNGVVSPHQTKCNSSIWAEVPKLFGPHLRLVDCKVEFSLRLRCHHLAPDLDLEHCNIVVTETAGFSSS